MNSQPPPLPSFTPPPLPKRPRWGLIVSVILVALFSIFAFFAFRIYSAISPYLKEDRNQRPFLVEAPDYETLFGEDISGSGFHFKHGGASYLCATLHQFDGKTPKVMASLDFDEPIKVTGVAHRQKDVQVLTFDSAKLAALPHLPYDSDANVNGGLPVYIYADSGVVKGHVTFVGKTSGRIRIRMAEPFPAAGCSGSPIVSGETGTVIGVLTEANHTERATRVVAERLVMPALGEEAEKTR